MGNRNRDRSDELFDNLHDAEQVRRLNKQAKKELREKRRKQWWAEHNPNERRN